jgi:hypothetical protein
LLPTAHFYLDLTRISPGDHSSHSILTSIVSPGNARVVAVQQHIDSDNPDTVIAYKVTLKICANTYLYLDHLNSLNDAISSSDWLDLTHGATLAAGAVIGTTTSTHAVDVGAFDTTYSAPFIRPDFYSQAYTTEESKVAFPSLSFKKCALSYFTSTAQDALLAKNPRTAPPICGDFAQDIAGTAAGNWFSTSLMGLLPRAGQIISDDPETLSLSHDSQDVTALAFSFGDGVPLTNADGTALMSESPIPMFTKFYFTKTNDPVQIADLQNPNFSDIPVGNEIYCFNNLKQYPWSATPIPDRIMLVQMRADGPGDHFPGKTILRMHARATSTCPAANVRHLNYGFTAEYFRD